MRLARALPPCFGISKSTAHRRFLIWSRAGVWGPVARGDPAPPGRRRPARPLPSCPRLRPREGEKGGELTGPSPVDRGEPGSKMHVLSDANGLPLLVGLSAANTHDSLALKPMIQGHQTRHDPHRGRYFKPRRLHADKAYDVPHLRKWLWGKHIGVRIARKGIESSERLGRRRWVIERTMSWLTGYRRLNHRYERHPRNYLAFLGLAAALCCYKRFLRLTT
ncbi:IS5 family transposase [Streptomyces sp. NPDC127036]|uniref:IS5 family transposase n=1 Tax=Streptomyces sp. NPDC127036 TaxID=3347112 RepID=UPI00364FDA60